MEINIKGMSCAGCSSAVERDVAKISGVSSCSVNLILAKANVEFDGKKQTEKKIIEAIEKLGFETSFSEKFDDKSAVYLEYKKKFQSSLVFTIFLLYIAMAPMVGINLPSFIDINDKSINFAIAQLLLTIATMYFGRNFYISGFQKLRNPNMDTLVAIGTTSAFLYSLYSTILVISGNAHAVHNLYFESVGTIITLILLGKTLETKALSKTSNAIKKLMELTPETAFKLENGEALEVNIESIQNGDVILVKPGSKVPVDGMVLKGSSYIDESMLTGESMPVSKALNDEVFTGTINKNGALEIKATSVGKGTLISKIIKFVEDAQATKAPIAKLADIISGKFVPIVMLIALVSGLLWSFNGFEFAMTIFVSVLVIACPCALGLATPTAIMVASGRAATLGVLFKNSETLEITHKADAIVFDKTGTITNGLPVVTDILAQDEKEFLEILYSGEKLSEHPIAQAICDYAKEKEIKELEVSDFSVIIGKGLSYKIGNDDILVSKEVPENSIYSDLAKEGKTVSALYKNGDFKGVIAVSDTVRDNALDLMKELKELGITTYMLTGDNEKTAKAIASTVGISEVISNVLPTEKADFIKKLKDSGKTVIMVGDGINDAPSLTVADIGISVSSGTDIAIESSDIVIFDISKITTAIKLSRKTLVNIKQNLFWAFIYNVIFIPVACGLLYLFNGPLLNPMFAAFAMSMSSFSVVTNALRLNRVKL